MRQREPLTAMQAAMLKAAVRSSMAQRRPSFAPLELIPQSTRTKQTFVPDVKPRHVKHLQVVVKAEGL